MSDLSPQAQELLRKARSFDEPNAADAERVHASVLAKVGIAVGAGAGVTAASTSLAASKAAVLGVTAMKLGAALVIAGGVATAGYVALRSPAKRPTAAMTTGGAPQTMPKTPAPLARSPEIPAPETPAPVVASTATGESAPRAAEVPPMANAKTARARASTPATGERTARAARATPDLEGEARLLEQADADLRRGDASAALAHLAEHADRYPTGALREEREGMRVVALCHAGREAEGKAAASRFLARSPHSTLATRIRAACGD